MRVMPRNGRVIVSTARAGASRPTTANPIKIDQAVRNGSAQRKRRGALNRETSPERMKSDKFAD